MAKSLLAGKSAGGANMVVKSVLCGSYVDHAQTMVVALAIPHCGLVQSWTVFVRQGDKWVETWHHKGTAWKLRAKGREIKETAPVSHNKGCQGFGSKWRLWKWTGKKFVPASWHETGHGTNGTAPDGLSLTPSETTVMAGETVRFRATFAKDGSTQDVTGKLLELKMVPSEEALVLGPHGTEMEHAASPNDCEQQLWGEQCLRSTQSCDVVGPTSSCCELATASCRTIWPGDWTVWAYYRGKGTYLAISTLHVRANESLSISPETLPPFGLGSSYSQQLHASGVSEGPLTWEFYPPVKGPEHVCSGCVNEKQIGGFSMHTDSGLITRNDSGYCGGSSAAVPFIARVRDDSGHSGMREYTIGVVHNAACP